MEGVVMQNLFKGVYTKKRVLLTGHTGFKGSWLAFWLSQMGAKVLGYALEPNTSPNHFSMLDLPIESVIGDIRDGRNLSNVFKKTIACTLGLAVPAGSAMAQTYIDLEKVPIDRTVLPLKAPYQKPITTLDARNAKTPPIFEVKAPKLNP